MSDPTRQHLWWMQRTAEDAAHEAWGFIKTQENLFKWMEAQDRLYEGIYLNRRFHRRGPHQHALRLLSQTGFSATRLNVVRSKLDTLTNKVAKQPAATRVNPNNAKYSLKRRSRQLRKFLLGKRQESDAQVLNQQIFRDAGVARTGCVKVVNEFGDIKLERVRRREIFVDPREGRDGRPRQMHQMSRVPREFLMEMFPKNSKARMMIEAANPAPVSEDDALLGHQVSDLSNLIEVAESIHLPSGPNAKDGRQLIHIETGPLKMQRWDRPRFPWVFFHWSLPFNEFWGSTSLVEQLADIQWKINETVRDIQEAIYFGANPHVFVRKGTAVNHADMAKRRGLSVVEYDGAQPPDVRSPEPVSQQKIEFLRFLLQQADDIVGVSQLAQAAKNPLGANASGAALQEFDDRESERFFDLDLRLGLFWRDVDEVCIDTAKEIAKDPKAQLTAIWSEGSLMRQIKWQDVDMERDQFTIQLEPTSFLPDTRAGKLAATERLAQAGVLKGSVIPAMFDFPDLKEAMMGVVAPRDAVKAFVEKVDDEDEELPTPDPHMNLELLDQELKNQYNRALAEGAPDETLKRYRDTFKRVLNMVQKAAPPAPAGPPLPPEAVAGAEGAVPGIPGEAGALPAGPAPETLPGAALPGVGGV